MKFTYTEVKEYNVKYIKDGTDMIASSSGALYHDVALRAQYQDMWDYCYDKITVNLEILHDNDFSRAHWSVHGDGCSGEHYTTIYCAQYEWFDTLDVEDQVTLGLLGFVL